jgi:hypothetical protein
MAAMRSGRRFAVHRPKKKPVRTAIRHGQVKKGQAYGPRNGEAEPGGAES